jgi:hypothetical protein
VFTAALLNNLVYPHDGDWPLALSLLPFLAQGRALYIILVYHTNSPEVSGSLLLLFAVGSITLIAASLIAEHGSIAPGIAKLFGQQNPANADSHLASYEEPHPTDEVLSTGSPNRALHQKVQMQEMAHSDIRRELDVDLQREKNRAGVYVKAKSDVRPVNLVNQMGAARDEETGEVLSPEEMDRLAIVLHAMKFRFPATTTFKDVRSMCTRSSTDAATARAGPVWAVNGMSLALSLGECFGLLGPNGAGDLSYRREFQ